MYFLPIRAFTLLFSLERSLRSGNFAAIHERVRRTPVRQVTATSHAVENVCDAVEVICLWYWKQVLCLQRSAATAILLREQGVAAELVIGAQHMPFRAHSWVEVDGEVVNDRSYTKEMYSVLDRC